MSLLLRGVVAAFVGLLIAGGTLTFAADRATPQRPTLVAVAPAAPTTLQVPDVTGQAYVFAKGILQDRGFAWHVSGVVQGFAANTVATQQPAAGTVVVDTGAPLVVVTLQRNSTYVENGTPDNDSPYPGTAIKLPANVPARPTAMTQPRLEPVQAPTPQLSTPEPAPTLGPDLPQSSTPAATTPTVTTPAAPVTAPVTTPTPTPIPAPTPVVTTARPVTTPVVSTPAPIISSTPRAADFAVPGAPKEPARSLSLPDRVAALAQFVEAHRAPSAANLNHWLYEHAYVVAGARFGWWHGVEALQSLIAVDKRAEALWGVGTQSRTTAQKALSEVRARRG